MAAADLCFYFLGTFLCLLCPEGKVELLIPDVSAFSVALWNSLENYSSVLRLDKVSITLPTTVSWTGQYPGSAVHQRQVQ